MTTAITERRDLAASTSAEFGRELRRLRRGAGMTLRSLAQQVAFDYSYLAQVERGDRAGSAKLAHRCDQALGVDGHLVRLFARRKVRQLMDERPGSPIPTPARVPPFQPAAVTPARPGRARISRQARG